MFVLFVLKPINPPTQIPSLRWFLLLEATIVVVNIVVFDVVVNNVVVLSLIVVADHIVISCGQLMFIWGSWRLQLSLCDGWMGWFAQSFSCPTSNYSWSYVVVELGLWLYIFKVPKQNAIMQLCHVLQKLHPQNIVLYCLVEI